MIEIRRWIGLDNPQSKYAGAQIHRGPTDDTIRFDQWNYWSVKVEYLLAAMDELDRFEGRKRLKGEGLEITIPTELDDPEDRWRVTSSLLIKPGEKGGQINIVEIGGRFGGGWDRTFERHDLRYAIKHRHDLPDDSA